MQAAQAAEVGHRGEIKKTEQGWGETTEEESPKELHRSGSFLGPSEGQGLVGTGADGDEDPRGVASPLPPLLPVHGGTA